MKKIKLWLLVLIWFMIFVFPVYAGMGYALKCASCGLKEKLFYESGMMMRVIANGYCTNCDKFQRISSTVKNQQGLYVDSNGTTMNAEEVASLDVPLGYVYCPYSKINKALYPCPSCSKPFMAIEQDDFGSFESPEKLYCPKCHKNTLQGQAGILWD